MAEIVINQDDARVQYTATAGQTVFAYDFPIFDETHLVVKQTLASDGSTSTLTLTTDYTVSDVGEEAGGDVTLVTGAAAGDIITIERDVPEARTTDFTTAGDFFASTLNRELDLLVMMIQEFERDKDRTLRLASESTYGGALTFADLTADQVLKVNAAGDGLETAAFADLDSTIDTVLSTLVDNDFLVYESGAWRDKTVSDVLNILGLSTSDTPQFTGIELGHASDTTLTRVSAGKMAVEGNNVLMAGTSEQLTEGFHSTEHDYGTFTDTQTLTVDLTKQAVAKAAITDTASATVTVAPDASRFGGQSILLTNGTGGGYTLTTSGWDKVFGTFDGAASKEHRLTAVMHGTRSVLHIDGVA